MNLYIMQMMQRRRYIVSEERNDMTPRRRRFRNPDTNEAPAAGSGNGPVPAETAADMTG